jgi:hypothetical protein
MRNRILGSVDVSLAVGFVLSAVVYGAHAQTQAESGSEDESARPATETKKPEYSRRKLPADTFKPSEEISEDFAVPFPVDI